MPKQIGAFRMIERHEMQPSGTGTMHRFRDSTAVNLSVILYDATSRRDERGADPRALVENEGRLFAEVLEIQLRRRVYRSYAPIVARYDSVVVGQGIVPGFFVAASAIHPGGRKSYEVQYMFLIGDMFVKVRVTIPEENWPRPDLESFVNSLVTTLASRS